MPYNHIIIYIAHSAHVAHSSENYSGRPSVKTSELSSSLAWTRWLHFWSWNRTHIFRLAFCFELRVLYMSLYMRGDSFAADMLLVLHISHSPRWETCSKKCALRCSLRVRCNLVAQRIFVSSQPALHVNLLVISATLRVPDDARNERGDGSEMRQAYWAEILACHLLFEIHIGFRTHKC